MNRTETIFFCLHSSTVRYEQFSFGLASSPYMKGKKSVPKAIFWIYGFFDVSQIMSHSFTYLSRSHPESAGISPRRPEISRRASAQREVESAIMETFMPMSLFRKKRKESYVSICVRRQKTKPNKTKFMHMARKLNFHSLKKNPGKKNTFPRNPKKKEFQSHLFPRLLFWLRHDYRSPALGKFTLFSCGNGSNSKVKVLKDISSTFFKTVKKATCFPCSTIPKQLDGRKHH